jgi:hypothetical protein
MSRRTSIVKALVEEFKAIDGTGVFKSNIFGVAEAKLKFWDECNSFPAIYAAPGTETREYLPGGFAWGFLNVCIKVYTKDAEESQQLLEDLLEDIEVVIDSLTGRIIYDTTNNYETAEISITSIVTDEGLLNPYGVGEVNLLIRYQVM